jgi:hypothetical protein
VSTPDVEQLQSTKSEKLLAVVMAVFLLMGGIWAYQRIDDRVRDWLPLRDPTASEQRALQRQERAQQRLFRAEGAVRSARSELELRREAYRTALDADEPAGRLRTRYLAANEAHEDARRQRARAVSERNAAQPAARAASARLARYTNARRDRQELVIFVVRVVAALVFLLAGYWLLGRLRGRGSRYLPLAGAVVAFATIFAFVVAGDYLTDYFEPFDVGILFLALIGVAVTLVAFWLLERYLRRRLPLRRARRRQCPFCGFPSRDTPRCEGCGRELVRPCATCGAPRRLGVPFCGNCGTA